MAVRKSVKMVNLKACLSLNSKDEQEKDVTLLHYLEAQCQ